MPARVALAGPSGASDAPQAASTGPLRGEGEQDEAERAIGEGEARLQRRYAGRPAPMRTPLARKTATTAARSDQAPIAQGDAAADRVASPMRSARWTLTSARRSAANAPSRSVGFDDQMREFAEAGATAKAPPSRARRSLLRRDGLGALGVEPLEFDPFGVEGGDVGASVDRAGAEKGEIHPNRVWVPQRPRPDRRAGARLDVPTDEDQLDAGVADEIGRRCRARWSDDEAEAGGERARDRGVGRPGVEIHDLARPHQRRAAGTSAALSFRRFGPSRRQ